eukprot:Skav202942  [mRNA]  locus=scaffold422:259827:262861:+ [translate_table: standard]
MGDVPFRSCCSVQIFWDPDPEHTLVEEDKEWVSLYYELPDEDENPERCGPWLLRIQLSNKVMTDKKLTVREATPSSRCW